MFEHFKPKIDVDFETEEGVSKKETLNFKDLSDFGVKGITGQSSFLEELTQKKEQYQKIIKQLKSNKLLKNALSGADSKQALINSLNSLIKELEQVK